MKKILAAVLAILFCFAFSSCNNESADVNVAEEIIIDDIKTEGSSAAVTTVTTTDADIISEASEAATSVSTEVHVPETVSETALKTETQTEATTRTDVISETKAETTIQTEIVSDTKAETTSLKLSETYGDILGEITGFHMTLTYPSADGQSSDYVFCAISLVTPRIYRIDAGGKSVKDVYTYLTDNQIKTVMDSILGMSVLPCDENVTKENVCEIKIENSSGDAVNSRVFGEIPDEITKLSKEVRKLAKLDFNDKKFDEMNTNIQNAINFRAVDVYSCLHSNLGRYTARGGDAAVYAGKGLTFKSRDEVNAAVDFLEEEPVMPIADGWDGCAFVKFAEDGSIEYVNWSEDESGLSEEPLTYSDCMAYYIENGKYIAFADYRKTK